MKARVARHHVRIGTVALGWLVLHAAPAFGEAFIERATAYRPEGPIVVDGLVDEPSWDAVERLGPFLETQAAERTQQMTTARILWDEEALYVAIEARDSDVWATITERDGSLWTEEVLEVFLDPDGDGRDYVEWEINPLGTELDIHMVQSYAAGGPARVEWDAAEVEAAVSVNGTVADRDDRDRGWSGEWRIPWSALEPFAGGMSLPPTVGDVWRVGLYRTDRTGSAGAVNSAWSPTRTPSFHTPERFGAVLFAAETARVGTVLGLDAVRVDDTGGDAGDGSGTPDPGERPEVWITVRNHAAAGAAGVTARLESAGPSTIVEQELLDLGVVGPFQEVFSGAFRVRIADDYEPQTPLPMRLVLTDASGRRWVEGLDLLLDDFTVPALSLEGSVRGPDGDALEGATVRAQPLEGGSSFTGVTDGSGEFLLEAPAGEYSISVTPAADGVVADWILSAPVLLEIGQRLQIDVPAYGQVRGRIANESGAGVAGARVQLSNFGVLGHYRLDTTTDADGAFGASVPFGSLGYLVEPPRDGGLESLQMFGAMGVVDDTVLDLTLRRTVRITGRLLTEDGEPVAAFLNANDPATGAFDFGESDAHGAYAFDLAPGTYNVRINPQDQDFGAQSLPLVVTEAGAIDLTLLASARVQIAIIDAEGTGVAGVSAFASAVDGSGDGFGETGAEGVVELRLVPGAYRIQFFASDGISPAPTTIDVLADTTIQLQLPKAYPVRGHVTLGNGDEAVGVGLQFIPVTEDLATTSGSFIFIEVVDGSYEAQLPAGHYLVTMFAQQDNEPPPQHVGEVVVTTAGAEFNAVLQAGHEVEGLLLDAQGEPLAGGQVLAAPLTGAATIIGEADGQGRFTLRLAAGEYRLLMVGPTFDVIWRATQFQVPHPELLVAQQPGGALVQGQVTDGDGVPSGALVFLTSRTRPWVSVLDAATAVSAFVGPDGRFSAEVEPGTYSLIALPDESGVGTGRLTSIELQAGDVLQADVALPSGDGNLRVTGQLRTAGTAAGAHFGVFYDEASGVFAVARVEAGRYAIDLPAGEYAVSVFVVSYFQDALGSYEMGTVTIDTDLTYDLVLADALSAVTDAPGALPESFHLDLAFPNPFNAQVTIPFALPGPALVTVTIHDILGQTVRQLRTAALPAGWHALHWDGTDDRHRPAASGVYLYRMKAGPYAHSRRFTLLR